MIVTEFKSRVPLLICAFGPMTVNGPISTSSSISADESIDALSAMRAAITEFSNCCQRLGEDEFVALRLSWVQIQVMLRTSPQSRHLKSLIDYFRLFHQS